MLEFKQKTWIEWAHPGKEHLRLQKFWASTRFQQILPELSNCSGLDHTRCFKKDSPGLVFFLPIDGQMLLNVFYVFYSPMHLNIYNVGIYKYAYNVFVSMLKITEVSTRAVSVGYSF